MPLDPFFDERLRLHRKYLFDQALSTVRTRLSTAVRFLRTPIVVPAGEHPVPHLRDPTGRSELRRPRNPLPSDRTPGPEPAIGGRPSRGTGAN
jgi:acetyl esterase